MCVCVCVCVCVAYLDIHETHVTANKSTNNTGVFFL